jgi:hypothetical protein
MQEIGRLGEEAVKAGKLVFQAGLQPTRAGWRMGSLAESRSRSMAVRRDQGGDRGFAIFECDSPEEAMKFAQQFVEAHARAGVRDMSMEVRPLFGPGDMGCPHTEEAKALMTA